MDNRNEGVFKGISGVPTINLDLTMGRITFGPPPMPRAIGPQGCMGTNTGLIGSKPLKYQEGKADVSLVPPMFIRVLARVFEYGLTKYYKNSWKEFTLDKAIDDLIPAAMRHIDEYRSGEYLDPVTKCPHLAAAAWNCLIVVWHSELNKDEYK